MSSDLAHKADVKVTIYFRKDPGYISAYTTYPKQDGEDWNRGNDLPDGEYNEETLKRVMKAVERIYNETKGKKCRVLN